MKNKLFKKLLTIGLLLALAACIFNGCASSGGGSNNDPPGILTITGIPAEYEGKFIKADIFNIPDYTKAIQSSNVLARAEPTAVMNGEVKLSFYIAKLFGKGGGYAGADPADVKLEIFSEQSGTEGKLLSTAAIASVAFNDGAAAAKWSDTLKPIYITVTNIPEIYNRGSSIQAGQKATKMPLVIGGAVAFGFDAAAASGNGRSIVSNATTTVPILPSRGASGYILFPERGTMDVVVSLNPPSSGSGVTVDHIFLFTAVPITNGRATLDFRRGIMQ